MHHERAQTRSAFYPIRGIYFSNICQYSEICVLIILTVVLQHPASPVSFCTLSGRFTFGHVETLKSIFEGAVERTLFPRYRKICRFRKKKSGSVVVCTRIKSEAILLNYTKLHTAVSVPTLSDDVFVLICVSSTAILTFVSKLLFSFWPWCLGGKQEPQLTRTLSLVRKTQMRREMSWYSWLNEGK